MKCINDILLEIKYPKEAVVVFGGESLCYQCLIARHLDILTDIAVENVRALDKNR